MRETRYSKPRLRQLFALDPSQVVHKNPTKNGKIPGLLLQNTFNTNDFVSSEFWVGGKNDKFSSWAAKIANNAKNQYTRNQSLRFTDLMRFVSNERFHFSNEIESGNEESHNKAGVSRQNDNRHYYSWIGGIDVNNTSSKSRLARLTIKLYPELDGHSKVTYVDESKNEGRSVKIFYTLESGTEILAETIYTWNADNPTVLNPRGASTSKQILGDVESRINKLLTKTNREDKDLNEFCIAMQGYFIAMPFVRGSASIGRILFSSLYSIIFKSKLKMDPDVDIYSMILNRNNFYEFVKNQ